MSEMGTPIGSRFTVARTEENSSIAPQLANFKPKVEYEAAAQHDASSVVYRVWYGPLEEQCETFDEDAFNRYFECLPLIVVDGGTTGIKDDLLLELLLYKPRQLARGYRLEELHAPIELAIQRCGEEIERARATVGDFERLWVEEIVDRECDQIEEFLGIAFATTQVVLTTFRTRLVRLVDYSKSDLGTNLGLDYGNNGRQLFKAGPELQQGCGFTAIEAINDIANYWKHKDEWTVNREERDGSKVSI